MADVAAQAGATSSEVALVIAGDTRIPLPLRQGIVDAVQTTGYRPLASIHDRLGRPARLAIVLRVYRGDEPEANRFYVPIFSAIASICASHGAEVVPVRMMVGEKYDALDMPPALLDGSCDGALFIGAQLDVAATGKARTVLPPTVLVDGYSAGDALDSVVTDNFAGGKMAVEHLVAAGHREIALLGIEPVAYPSMQARRAGYAQTLASLGLRTHFIDIDYLLDEAAAMLGVDYLVHNPEVSAVFGANDLITVALLNVARDAGLRVPADLSLVGFDDIDLASLVMPALTTLAVDKPLMGRAGFALLAHRLERPEAERVEAVFTPRLVERESVGPPRPR
jgi:DNA-binding LacI/PurR family transcriptional regulator